jgi:hypothetical protein
LDKIEEAKLEQMVRILDRVGEHLVTVPSRRESNTTTDRVFPVRSWAFDLGWNANFSKADVFGGADLYRPMVSKNLGLLADLAAGRPRDNARHVSIALRYWQDLSLRHRYAEAMSESLFRAPPNTFQGG